MNSFFIFSFVLFSFVFCQKPLLSFDGALVSPSDFFQRIPHSDWVLSDSTKRELYLSMFIEKELIYHYALSSGFSLYSENYVKLKKREKQLLINLFYEKIVASKHVDRSYLLDTQQYIYDKVYVYHLLLGYKECALGGVFERTREEAFSLAESISSELFDSLFAVDFDEKELIFSSFAKRFSEDPSAQKNKGELGWVSWGQVMPSFQKAAFNSPVLTVSEPVLTDYGYHLIFVKKRGLSDYYYYNKEYLAGLLYKFGLQSVSVDSLRNAAEVFDSLFIEKGSLVINDVLLDKVLSLIKHKTKTEKLRGGKNVYVDWFEEIKEREVLFVFNNKGFGLGWFINKIRNAPATRIPSLKNKEDFSFLLRYFLLQEGVLSLAYKEGLQNSFYFRSELQNHSKNILYNSYKDFVLSGLPKIDSSVVTGLYNQGVFRGDYIKPKEVFFTEIRVSSKILADSLYNDFLLFGDFDKLSVLFGGKLKKPISDGGGGFIGEAAFSLSVGGVSTIIENLNKTFSFLRVEKFIEAEPFVLSRVYSQIERKIKNERQDSVKKNLGVFLFEKYSPVVSREVLSF